MSDREINLTGRELDAEVDRVVFGRHVEYRQGANPDTEFATSVAWYNAEGPVPAYSSDAEAHARLHERAQDMGVTLDCSGVTTMADCCRTAIARVQARRADYIE